MHCESSSFESSCWYLRKNATYDASRRTSDATDRTTIVRKLADCAGATDVDSCRELFLNVSSCKICPPDDGNVDGCIKDAVSTWLDANQSELEAH